MKSTMVSSLTLVFALTIPATVGLIMLSRPIIRVIFEHGAFTPADTLATAGTLSLYAVGLFAYSANKVLVPAFYALDKTRFPVIASFMAIAFNIVIVTLTIDRYGHLAIALSTSVTMVINFHFLMLVLYRSLNGYSLKYLLKGLVKIGSASVGILLFLAGCKAYCSSWLEGSLIQQCCSLAGLIIVSALIYGTILHLLRLEELTILTDRIRIRFFNKKTVR